MTRGKYAAKAANRLAEIDAGLVAELREKLAATAAERDAARAEVDRLSRRRDSDARAVGELLAADAVRDMSEKLAEEKRARDEDRLRYATGVSKVIGNAAFAIKATMAGWADLADVFDLRGEDLADFMGYTGNPRKRRVITTDYMRNRGEAHAQRRGMSDAVALRLVDHAAKGTA